MVTKEEKMQERITYQREELKKKTVSGYEVWRLLSELHLIAKQLGEPINSPKVCLAYTKKHEGLPNDLTIFVFHPIYFPPESCYYSTNSEEYIDPDFYEELQKEAINKEIVEYVNECYPK